MKIRMIYLLLLVLVIAFPGCHYRKGRAFTWSQTGDTVRYIIAASGSGKHVMNEMNGMVRRHRLRKDDCRVIFVSDSATLVHTRSLLLFNSVLPDLRKDMLSKGFFGTFTSRQIITYLVVTRSDLEKGFTPTD
jgi:hypothetical protein